MSEKNALMLGMIYSKEERAHRGQGFRDRVRCEAVENMKGNDRYNVYSLDNKHSEDLGQEGKHCQANFSDHRRMMHAIVNAWGRTNVLKNKFDTIILDYFFSPAGWARERWTENFFESTLPRFAEILKDGGTIWLPHLEVTRELLVCHYDTLHIYYDIDYVEDPEENPLYKATDTVEDELLRCPDKLINDTQLKPLLEYSASPFICLTKRKQQKSSNNTKMLTPNTSSKKVSRNLNNDFSQETNSSKKRRM